MTSWVSLFIYFFFFFFLFCDWKVFVKQEKKKNSPLAGVWEKTKIFLFLFQLTFHADGQWLYSDLVHGDRPNLPIRCRPSLSFSSLHSAAVRHSNVIFYFIMHKVWEELCLHMLIWQEVMDDGLTES